MPSKISPSQTTPKNKPVSAKDLIAQVQERRKVNIHPCPEAVAELRTLMEHNDGHPEEWVSVDQAQAMLKSWGWIGERTRFDRMIKEVFGRTWGGK